MKKCLAFMLALLMLAACTIAAAEENLWTTLGEGKYFLQLVVVYNQEQVQAYNVYTDQETMMEALVELELISVEKTVDGYRLMTVGGVAADPEPDGSYWYIGVYNDELKSFVDMEIALEDALSDQQIYTFGYIVAP